MRPDKIPRCICSHLQGTHTKQGDCLAVGCDCNEWEEAFVRLEEPEPEKRLPTHASISQKAVTPIREGPSLSTMHFMMTAEGASRVFTINDNGSVIGPEGPAALPLERVIDGIESYRLTFLNDYCWPEIEPVSSSTRRRWLNNLVEFCEWRNNRRGRRAI